MNRENISKKIQSNQKVSDSTRCWIERLVDDIFQSINEYKKTRRESLLRLRKKMMYQRDYIHSFNKRSCFDCKHCINNKFCRHEWWFKNETISDTFEIERDFYCKHYEK